MARTKTSKADPNSRADGDQTSSNAVADSLSYNEAQTALELVLAQLQSADLPVEQMADLYQRAQRYADRCEQLLAQVEQTIELWDPQDPDRPPQPFSSEP